MSVFVVGGGQVSQLSVCLDGVTMDVLVGGVELLVCWFQDVWPVCFCMQFLSLVLLYYCQQLPLVSDYRNTGSGEIATSGKALPHTSY